MESLNSEKTWLPRFTEEDFYKMGGVAGHSESYVPRKQVVERINRLLADFEKTCRVETGYLNKTIMGDGRREYVSEAFVSGCDTDCVTHERLVLQPRPIKRGVAKHEIESLLDECSVGYHANDVAGRALALLSRIKKNGITE